MCTYLKFRNRESVEPLKTPFWTTPVFFVHLLTPLRVCLVWSLGLLTLGEFETDVMLQERCFTRTLLSKDLDVWYHFNDSLTSQCMETHEGQMQVFLLNDALLKCSLGPFLKHFFARISAGVTLNPERGFMRFRQQKQTIWGFRKTGFAQQVDRL